MKKYLSIIAGTLFFIGLIALASTMSSSGSEIKFFAERLSRKNRTHHTSRIRNSSSNISNYENSTSDDTIEALTFEVNEDINLVLSLPSRNFTKDFSDISNFPNMSIYIHNAVFVGKCTHAYDVIGKIYAKLDLTSAGGKKKYPNSVAVKDLDVIFRIPSHPTYRASYNYSLLPIDDEALSEMIFDYLYYFAEDDILRTMGNTTTNKTTTYNLPSVLIDRWELAAWYNTSVRAFISFTPEFVKILDATFTGTANPLMNGTIRAIFNAGDLFGWVVQVLGTIDVNEGKISNISYQSSLPIDKRGCETFLRAWVKYLVMPYFAYPYIAPATQF